MIYIREEDTESRARLRRASPTLQSLPSRALGPTRILFVCMGNICRSPTAEGVMRALLKEEGVEGVEVESAGIGDWHLGHSPDRRATDAARLRGIVLEGAA